MRRDRECENKEKSTIVMSMWYELVFVYNSTDIEIIIKMVVDPYLIKMQVDLSPNIIRLLLMARKVLKWYIKKVGWLKPSIYKIHTGTDTDDGR